MKLIRCPRCDHVVDIEWVDELGADDVIGCGLNKGDLAWCDGCACENEEISCAVIRREKGYTKTRVRDLNEDTLRF